MKTQPIPTTPANPDADLELDPDLQTLWECFLDREDYWHCRYGW